MFLHRLVFEAVMEQDGAEALRYCRQDVKITQQLLNAAKWEFDLHPLPNLLLDKAYSPASLAKAYMREMNIVEPLNKFKVYR